MSTAELDPGTAMSPHHVVSREAWTAARQELLKREKEFTRLRDRLSEERRSLPWVKVDKNYVFETPDGERTLADLFDGRSQLIVKHFMLGPDWTDGCVGCSFETDHLDAALVHLEHHDVTVVAVSRAPLPKIEVFKERMGWRIKWVSSFGSDFNYDYHVSFTPDEIATGEVYYNYRNEPFVSDELSGFSVFYKDEAGSVFHTYSTYGRGAEELLGTYVCLDLTPKGRNETGPRHNLTDWVRHHDRYDAPGHVSSTGQFVTLTGPDCGCGLKEG